jgi:signal transduction histidine kinase/ActR/RegA family two-component response regulator
MRWLGDLPIRWKLVVVTVATSAIVEALALAAIMFYFSQNYSDRKADEYAVQARVLADSLAAPLIFGDAAATREYLNALRSNPEIAAAGAYGADGNLVAQYKRIEPPHGALPVTAPRTGARFDGARLLVSQSVERTGVSAGSIFLVVDTETLADQLAQAGVLMLLAIMGSLLIAVPVSMRLNASVSDPLRDIAAAAARIKAGDLTVELPQSPNRDEVGVLVAAFGQMVESLRDVMQQERLRALGQMASGVAHDINNALSPVALYTDSLLEQEDRLDAPVRNYLQMVQRVVADVTATVSRMNDFSRKRAPQMALAPVNLNDVARQALDLTRARWSNMQQEKGIVIAAKTDLAADLPAAMGIASEIREALTNLIFNASDAMPTDGTLTIRTRAIGGERPTHVVLEVSDTGTGMDEETRRRCLEPFFTTKGERGTGLGLAMVYGMIQRHSADIEIDSEKGKGTTIRLIFLARADAAGVTAEAKAAVPAKSPLRLLVVDDDPSILDSMCDVLKLEGHEVVAANGGKEGIEAFRSRLGSAPFATVITDLSMPHVDGHQVAKAVKEMSPSTPIILLTGWGRKISGDGEIPVNIDCVLAKPPKLAELRAAFERWA